MACIASLDVLAEAVVKVVEGDLGMLEAAGDKVFAYDDGSVCAVIDSIAGAERNALARHGVLITMWGLRWRVRLGVFATMAARLASLPSSSSTITACSMTTGLTMPMLRHARATVVSAPSSSSPKARVL